MEASSLVDLEHAPEGQPKGPSAEAIIRWLVVLGLAMFYLPLYLISAGIGREVAGLQCELEPLQAALTRVNTPGPQVVELKSTLDHVQASIGEIEAARPTIAASHYAWPAIMAAIGSYDPARLRLLSITQSGGEIALKGRTVGDSAVAAYAHALESSSLFDRVVVQSMKTVATPAPSPTGTPSTTPTPKPSATPEPSPTATPTPTHDPRDAYEPDDSQPRSIFLGKPQTHNFCPANDIDQVRFLAKAGRYYRVSTSGLAPGVDTFLIVRLGDEIYTNDDCKPGSLSSEIIFQVPAGTDLQAVAQIGNRGDYGPDMWYQVTCEEIIPTPTPVRTATATLSPTSTTAPTATMTPSVTPTSAPDAAHGPGGAPREAVALAGASPPRKVPGLASLLPGPARNADLCTVEFVIVLVLKAAPL